MYLKHSYRKLRYAIGIEAGMAPSTRQAVPRPPTVAGLRIQIGNQEEIMANFLTRFDPFTDLASFAPLREVDDLWRDMRRRYQLFDDAESAGIRLDVAENDREYTVSADIPGVNKEDIKVDVQGNRVSIAAEVRRQSEVKGDGQDRDKVVRSERYVGRQYRSFTLEHAIDDTAASARYENGVLQLTLPKKANEGARKLQIS